MAETNELPVHADGTEKTEKSVVEFSEEQQAKLQKIIDGAVARVAAKKDTEIEQLRLSVNELKTKLEVKPVEPTVVAVVPPKEPKEPKEPKKQDDSFVQVQAQLAEMKALAELLNKQKDEAEAKAKYIESKNKDSKMKEAFITASEKIDFFDRMEVFELIRSQLDVDERGNVVIINSATGQPRINTSLENMSLVEFLVEYAKEKPWKVKAKNPEGGLGSQESRKVDKGLGKEPIQDVTKLSNEEFLALTESIIAKQYER